MKALSLAKSLLEAASTLAASAQALGEAEMACIFLPDYTYENLVFTASSPEKSPESAPLAVPMEDLEDPLCFSVHKATICTVALNIYVSLPPSLRFLAESGNFSRATVFPLLIPGSPHRGALLLLHNENLQCDEKTMEILCFYGAAVMENAIQKKRYQLDFAKMHKDLSRLETEQTRVNQWEPAIMIGDGKWMQKLRSQIPAIAASPATVLITGETGTGKGLMARALHEASSRRKQAFVEINCGALPESLLASELFGHVKGAFTGADRDHPGLFRSAHGGTIFLDEIGNLSVNLQAVLLNILQEKKVRPVGGVQDFQVDVRIIAATNRNLKDAIREGSFRMDLYHRLAVVTIELPPLSRRRGDIPLLAAWFLERFKKQYRVPELELSAHAMHMLHEMSFPGNIRELASKIEHAVLLSSPSTKKLLPLHFKRDEADDAAGENCIHLPEYLAEQEAGVIRSVLQTCRGNIQLAAKNLGIPRRTLARKISKYGLG